MGESTVAGPARRRNRNLLLAFGSGFLGRGISVVAPLVIVPILLSALGEVRFGVWATVTSLTSMLVFADLGLGSGLLTRLSSAYGEGDLPGGRRIVSNSYVGVGAIAIAGILVSFLVLSILDVAALLGVGRAESADARAIVAVVLTAFFCSMPLSLVVRVQLGVQQAWQSNSWAALGPLISIPLVWGLARADAGATVVTAGAVAGPMLVLVVNSIVFYATRLGRSLRPSPRLASRVGARELVGIGSAFALLSILSNVAINADNPLIALVLGSADVTPFVVASRLFRSTALLISIVGMPLWGASGEALSRGDLAWVRRSTAVSALGLAAVALVMTGTIVVFREPIINAWVGPSVETPLVLYSGLAAWSVLLAVTTPFFMVQNAAGLVRIQVIGWGAYLVASMALKVWGLVVFGVGAVPWLGAACFCLTVAPSALFGYRRVMRTAQARQCVQ